MPLSLNPMMHRDAVEMMYQETVSWNAVVSDIERSLNIGRRAERHRDCRQNFEEMQHQPINHPHSELLRPSVSDQQQSTGLMSPLVPDDEAALTALVSLIDALQRMESSTVSAVAEPLDAGVAEAASETSAGERYKTELCRAFEERGQCRYAEKCQFAHGVSDLRTVDRHPKYKTELCRTFHSTGFCPYGARCHFVHNEQPFGDGKSDGSSPPVSDCNNVDRQQQLVIARREMAAIIARRSSSSTSDDEIPRALQSPRGGINVASPSKPSLSSSVACSMMGRSGQNTASKTLTTAIHNDDYDDDDVGSVLLQHRRRQNLVALNLSQSPSGGLPVWLMPPPSSTHQCRPSPPLSAADSGLFSRASSTGSPTMSEVFSPTASPIPPQMVPSNCCPTPDVTRPPPPHSANGYVTPMYNLCVLSGLEWSPAFSTTNQLSAHSRSPAWGMPPSTSLFTDSNSRRFFGFAGEMMASR